MYGTIPIVSAFAEKGMRDDWVAAGLCVRFFFRGKSFFTYARLQARNSRDIHPNPALRLVLNVWRNVKATGPYGISLTAV